MPVHETKGGYKYGETGKTYKDKKSAIKQAIAIAYSKAEKKGRKPSQEEIKTEISGNPDIVEKTASAELSTPQYRNITMDRNQMLRNYAGRLRKKASALEKQAQWGEWASKAGEWLSNPENLGRLGIGGGTWLASYLASGILDPKKKNRGVRALLSGVPAVLAATKGYDWAAERLDNARTAAEQARRTAEANKHIAEQDARLRDEAVNQKIDEQWAKVRAAWRQRAIDKKLADMEAKAAAGSPKPADLKPYVRPWQQEDDTGPATEYQMPDDVEPAPIVDPVGAAAREKAAYADPGVKQARRNNMLRLVQLRQRLADIKRRENIRRGGTDPYAYAAGELTPAEQAKRNAPMKIPAIGPDVKGAITRELSDKGRGFVSTLWHTLTGGINQKKMQRDLDAKIKARNERAALEAELKQLTGK